MTLLRLSVLFPILALSVAAQSNPQQAGLGPNIPAATASVPSTALAPADAPVIYVSDFDLDVVQRKPAPKPRATRNSPTSASRSPSGVPRTGPAPVSEATNSQSTESEDSSGEETPADQAKTLVKAVSENIIRALRQAGFDARRLAANAPLPQQGVRVSGVFAEADEQNRARRLLVGGEPSGGNLILYVGLNNLKNPEQHLYELASPQDPDPRHGPIITVTSYAPAARYELSRDPSGEELEKISKQTAADLGALVAGNRLTLGQ